MKLLLVEDNPALTDMVGAHLRERGFAVDTASTGAEALAALASASYDAMILDLGLPDMNGMDVLRITRSNERPGGSMLPALILTARDAVRQRVDGLNAGADDYILKPFNLEEFEARLRAVLRRPGARDSASHSFGDVSFNSATRSARVRGEALDLTRREAALFEALITNAGQVVVRDVLIDRLYGLKEDVSVNALEATMSRVRRKLAGSGTGVGIETLRGIGYRLGLGAAAPPQ